MVINLKLMIALSVFLISIVHLSGCGGGSRGKMIVLEVDPHDFDISGEFPTGIVLKCEGVSQEDPAFETKLGDGTSENRPSKIVRIGRDQIFSTGVTSFDADSMVAVIFVESELPFSLKMKNGFQFTIRDIYETYSDSMNFNAGKYHFEISQAQQENSK